MNNLPVDLMGTINNQGIIMASLASGKPAYQEYSGYSHALSGWRLIPEMFSHSKHPVVPSIINTMLASSLAACNAHEHRMSLRADYAFHLGVDKYALLDSEHWSEIRDLGYENAIKIIDQYGLTPEKLGV